MDEEKKKLGRPEWKPTEKDIENIKEWASKGATMEQCAAYLQIASSTFFVAKNKFSDISQAYEEGKAKDMEEIVNAMRDKAKGGDNIMMIYYSSNRDPDNWVNTQRREVTGKKGEPIKTEETVKVIRMTACRPNESKPDD